MPRRTPAATASVIRSGPGAKLSAPAADRNVDALCDLLSQYAPSGGAALEIASGTGQHIVRFAATCPHLTWQPTDIDPIRLSSIDAYIGEAGFESLDGLAVSFQAQNLSDEPYITVDGSGNVQDYQRFGRTFLLNARYKF